MSAATTCGTLIIGGGFYGCAIALALAERGKDVLVIEKEVDLLTRASFRNQARVHGGYHYPRSVLTAMRSRVNLPRWVEDYRACVVDEFEQCYAIARRFSKVSAAQFARFMDHVGAPLTPAPARLRRLFNDILVEDAFLVREHAFDAAKLREMMRARLDEARVPVKTGVEALRIGENLLVETSERPVQASEVFLCAYSGVNTILEASGLPHIRLKHELAELALIEMPEELRQLGVTVMCGPFFSFMPFPARGCHSLSHVRYTPHASWQDAAPADVLRTPRVSNFPLMLADARRFVPALARCRQLDSLWEIKTVLPASETDDSRPILFQRHWGRPNLHCVLGAKIDNIFDVLTECAALG